MQLNPIRKTFTYGAAEIDAGTGEKEMARQAHGCGRLKRGRHRSGCTWRIEAGQGKPGFLPLTGDNVEKTYAAGKEPGGFSSAKAEALGKKEAALTARMTIEPNPVVVPWTGFTTRCRWIAQVAVVQSQGRSDTG